MAMSEAQCTLRASLRKLWADHVIWTRQYIVAFASDGADTGAAAGRLLKNQEHIGNAIVPFYGQAAGAQLTDLLKQHILIAVDLLTAAKAGDDAEFQRQDQRWSQNVEEIAALLSGANPNWPKNDVVDLLGVHLKLTKDEAVARLTGKWDDDVVAFDDIFTEIMTVSDTLADGIVKQFPERFVTPLDTRASNGDRRAATPRIGACLWAGAVIVMLAIGQRAADFRDLQGVDGKRYSLATFAHHPFLVVAFICTGCPTVKANEERLVALQERYNKAGVQLVAINANNPYLSPPDTVDEMVRRAHEKQFNFPYLKDADGSVAEQFGAISTPHVFVFDASRRLAYKGRIDDTRDPARATSSDLENALRDLFAGSPVRVAETQPFGCAIVR